MPIRVKQRGKLFGLEFSKCLVARSCTAADLSRQLVRNRRPYSKQFLGMLAHNKRSANPQTIDAITVALRLQDDEAVRLHRAAALDAGFKIGGM